MDIQRLGDTIATYRQNRKMTQEEFASRLGVTSQAVSKWERGLGCPDITLIEGICTILKISPEALFEVRLEEELAEQASPKGYEQAMRWLCSEPVELLIGIDLIEAVVNGLKTDTVDTVRLETAKSRGALLPVIRIRDEGGMDKRRFCIRCYGKELLAEELDAVTPESFRYMIQRAADVVCENYAGILNRDMVRLLVDNVKEHYPAAAESVPEIISYGFLRQVLAGLLEKGKSIRNLIKILEITEDCITAKPGAAPEEVVQEIMNKGI